MISATELTRPATHGLPGVSGDNVDLVYREVAS